ncbi:MAG: gliding motility-associated C-terminal domain-containing protein [Ginsengibacter sp.]
MPNAFTPNLNDVFYPIARGIETIANFSIFDRGGHLVFQNKNFTPNDRTFSWDGSFKGAKYSTAVFVYVLEAFCDSGEKLSKRGTVALIR